LTVLLRAAFTAVFTASTIMALQASVNNVSDLKGKTVCAGAESSAPYKYLDRRGDIQLVPGITAIEDMWPLYEGYQDGGNKFGCEAVVYDWPLLKIGYIRNRGQELAASDDEVDCKQCPGESVLVGEDLNSDPYGIALPHFKDGAAAAETDHPMLETLVQASLLVIRDAAFRKNQLEEWGLTDAPLEASDKDSEFSLNSALFEAYGLALAVVAALVIALVALWCTLRNRLDLEAIEQELKDADTTQYIHEEVNLLDATRVHLSEDHELTHEIRLEINKIKAIVVELLKFHEVPGLSHPERNVYDHGSYVPLTQKVQNIFQPHAARPASGAGGDQSMSAA